MGGLRQMKVDRARDYILAHPDETKLMQALGAKCSTTMIAQVRAQLIIEGKLAPSRKKTAEPKPPALPVEEPLAAAGTPPAPRKPAGLLDHEAMQAMADMIDKLADLDDEEIHKRLLKQCIQFAFDPRLHPDTRMSASQMWAKLRDQAKAKDLGPGAPVTFEEGVERMRDLMVACGAPMTLAAVNAAFTVEDSHDETTDDQAASPVGTTEVAGPAGHAGDSPQAEVVRPIDMGLRGLDNPGDSLEHPSSS